MPWPIGSDALLKVSGLRDPVQDEYVNVATVRATMTADDDGAEVAGMTWPLTLQYVAQSDGVYQALLEDGLELVEGRLYWMTVVADAGADLVRTWRWRDVARHEKP